MYAPRPPFSLPASLPAYCIRAVKLTRPTRVSTTSEFGLAEAAKSPSAIAGAQLRSSAFELHNSPHSDKDPIRAPSGQISPSQRPNFPVRDAAEEVWGTLVRLVEVATPTFPTFCRLPCDAWESIAPFLGKP